MQTKSQKNVDVQKPQQSTSVLVKQSVGEAFDKFTILNIKTVKLTGIQHDYVTMERDAIGKALKEAGISDWLSNTDYLELSTINSTLWDLENRIRSIEATLNECEVKTNMFPMFTEEYVLVSRKIRELNETRARCKNLLNKTYGSMFQEVKKYDGFETEVADG